MARTLGLTPGTKYVKGGDKKDPIGLFYPEPYTMSL